MHPQIQGGADSVCLRIRHRPVRAVHTFRSDDSSGKDFCACQNGFIKEARLCLRLLEKAPAVPALQQLLVLAGMVPRTPFSGSSSDSNLSSWEEPSMDQYQSQGELVDKFSAPLVHTNFPANKAKGPLVHTNCP